MRGLLLILLLFSGKWCFSQNDLVMKVNGGNSIPLFSKSTMYIDSSNSKSIQQIDQIRNRFKKINHPSNLIQKQQPNTIWVHTFIKNTGKEKEYWLGIYSQMDSLSVYRKTDKGFVLLNRSDMSDFHKLKNHHIRFHYTPLTLRENEQAEIYMKILDSRHYQNIYADFTTPADSLIWETGFYWEIGFVVGVACIIALLSIMLGAMLRRKHYFFYAAYLTLIAIIVIREELFISIVKIPFLYKFIFQSNSIFLLVIAMGLGMKIIISLIGIKEINKKLHKILNLIFNGFVFFGTGISIWYYFDYESATFSNPFYIVIWDISIVLSVLSVVLEVAMLLLFFIGRKKPITGIVISLFYGVFNPVTYFLNYSRILTIYEISHPNYFYYVLFLEIFVLGIAIAYNYREIRLKYIRTLEDKLKLEEENRNIQELQDEKIKISILESGNHLLKNLSKELHDDIGQKLSVINFSIENMKLKNPDDEQITEIKSTIVDVSNSLRDLSHWLNDFNFKDNDLDDILRNETERLNKINRIQFNFEKRNHSEKNYESSLEENIILYRCFQECINNTLKHSDAARVDILLDYSQKISLKIKDDGKGFNVKNEIGSGIKNLKERTEIIGFGCKITSEQENGTEILIYKE